MGSNLREFLMRGRSPAHRPSHESFACRGPPSSIYSDDYDRGTPYDANQYTGLYGPSAYSAAERCLRDPVPYYAPPASMPVGRSVQSYSSYESFAPREDRRREGVCLEGAHGLPAQRRREGVCLEGVRGLPGEYYRSAPRAPASGPSSHHREPAPRTRTQQRSPTIGRTGAYPAPPDFPMPDYNRAFQANRSRGRSIDHSRYGTNDHYSSSSQLPSSAQRSSSQGGYRSRY